MTEPLTWVERVKARQRPEQPSREVEAYTGPTHAGSYVEAALEGEIERVSNAVNGTRNATLNRAAFALGQFVGAGDLDEGRVVRELTAAAQLVGLDMHEIGPTLASGLRGGKSKPRRAPVRGWLSQEWPVVNINETVRPAQVSEVETAHETGETAQEMAARAHARHIAAVDAELRRLRARAEAEGILAAERDRDLPIYHEVLALALVTSAGLDAIPEPIALVDNVLFVDSLGWLIGPPGNGKSFVALDIAGSVGTGTTWQGFPVKQGAVLYVVAEGLSGIRARVRAWESASGREMAGVWFLPMTVQAAAAPAWAGLVRLVEQMQPCLIVLDTQARLTVGMEENSAKDMGEFVAKVDQLRTASGACVLVVHHQGRSGDHMRGSTALEGAATTIIRVAKDEEQVMVECAKQKDAAPFDQILLRLVPHGSSAVLSLTDAVGPRLDTPGVRRLLSDWWSTHQSDWVSVSTIVDTRIASKATFHRLKFALEATGVVEKCGDGTSRRYRLRHSPE